jgi:putative glutathione S-transferase
MSIAHSALDEIDQASGAFKRTPSQYRHQISQLNEIYKPEANRYHLYISLACPWANRCYSMLYLKGLQHIITVDILHPTWSKTKLDDSSDKHFGWTFFAGSAFTPPSGFGSIGLIDGCTNDTVNGMRYIRDIYESVNDNVGKYTVPILYDKKTKTIVNNESSEIIRMINSEFNEWANGTYDFYPVSLRESIDSLNAEIYTNINDGVYKCGFAKSQSAYNDAARNLYSQLDKIEEILQEKRYLMGNTLTECDIRLFMTLVRFDEVYVVYFKCNKKMIAQYENINNYCRELYQLMSPTISMDHIKTHYYTSHAQLNPFSIIPVGPDTIVNLLLPHDRTRFG